MNSISYGFTQSPFGRCLLATRGESICHLSFPQDKKETVAALQKRWSEYLFVRDDKKVAELAAHIFDQKKVVCEQRGTPFQQKVWDALKTISYGTTVSYSQVAVMIGQPKAVRAVASAIAKNEIAFVIPCHRVISKTGNIHKYRWGTDIKKRILQWEQESNRSAS